MEHIPAYIFDWIEQKPFSSLAKEQQEKVVLHFSKAEYDELHEAAIIAATYAQQGKETVANADNSLAVLHTVFDATYPEKKQLKPIIFWKVAASFLLLASAIFSFGWYKAQHQKAEVITHIITDTVFVERAKTMPHEVKVYDTVYLEKSSKNNRNGVRKHRPKYSSTPLKQKDLVPLENPLNSIPFSDRDQPQNRPKKNSIKDDSLIQNFDFIQL